MGTEAVSSYIVVLGCFRIVIGLTPILAAGPAVRLLGFPVEHDNPTGRVMARLFGVRDIGLGVMAIGAALAHPSWLGFVCLFNAAHDAGDAAMFAWPLLRRSGIDRAATIGLLVASSAVAFWLLGWVWSP